MSLFQLLEGVEANGGEDTGTAPIPGGVVGGGGINVTVTIGAGFIGVCLYVGYR